MTHPPRRRHGFVLGKFLPPHAGHVFLCDTGARRVDVMTVLVCSHDAEPIPGPLRTDWMRRLLPHCRVVPMHRDIPQEPAEHPDFWAIWRAAITEHHPEPIDQVFGSDPYVFRLAAELGAEPVLVDPDRAVFPVSGRAIRADPAAHWNQVPAPVRPYYQKRVCVLGPESSGKTRLSEALARRFRTRVVLEYGRTYDRHYRQGAGWTGADFVALAETHLAMRRALTPHAAPIVIEDTDPLQTAAWARFLTGAEPPALAALIAAMDPADLYLVLSPEVDWIDDGTRYSGDAAVRQWFFETCQDAAARVGAPMAVIQGCDWTAREAAAEDRVRAAFPTLARAPSP